ncbi:MAG TPA: 5'-deoxynucleotidase [Ruminococcaceae bacterium]|nr:5'-deoxynucleotidase [Oscillospiraceae bacterium]HCB64499.1 5'-deoxynucleotidase [Oscillospiraceae bacterium]
MEHSSFYAMLFRMKYINRWGLMRNTRWENLSEHSLETAMLAHILAVIGNKRLGRRYSLEKIVLHALYHDCSEILTGDLPTPVKYDNPALQGSYKEVERAACERLANLLPCDLRGEIEPYLSGDGLDEDSRKLVKAADRLSALIKCMEEEKAGNREFVPAKASTLAALQKMDLDEVEIFLSEFLPAFSLALDELEIKKEEAAR